MKIQIVALAERDMIIEFKDYFAYPPPLNITQASIDLYIEKLLKMKECEVIKIRKWKD